MSERKHKEHVKIQIVSTVIYSPVKVLDLQCTNSEFRMADVAQVGYCFLCLSVRCKTSLEEALGGGVRTWPLFKNMTLIIRPNLHRNSEVERVGAHYNCFGDSRVDKEAYAWFVPVPRPIFGTSSSIFSTICNQHCNSIYCLSAACNISKKLTIPVKDLGVLWMNSSLTVACFSRFL